MSFEQSGAAPDQLPSYFETSAENKLPLLLQRMDLFVSSHTVEQSDVFGERSDEVDFLGEELAYALLGELTDTSQIIDIQRCLRFGLQLCRELSDNSPAYTAGLDELSTMFRYRYGGDVRQVVSGSYDRYLYRRPNLMRTLHGNLKLLAHAGCQEQGQNVISFLLEMADYASYEAHIAHQMSAMDAELRTMLDRPPDMPSNGN